MAIQIIHRTAALGLLLVGLAGQAVAASDAASPVAPTDKTVADIHVLRTTGHALLLTAHGTQYQPLAVDMTLAAGDQLIVLDQSEVILVYPDGCEQKIIKSELIQLQDHSPCEAAFGKKSVAVANAPSTPPIVPNTPLGSDVSMHDLAVATGPLLGFVAAAAVLLNSNGTTQHAPLSP